MAFADVSGERVGRYSLLLRIGMGGMGEVFVAVLRGAGNFRNLVACKRLLAAHADAETYVESLREEARIAAMVRHPNVCQVYELVEDPTSGLVLVMEYLEGVPLRRLASPTSDLRLVGSLIAQACEGLHAIHELVDLDGRSMRVVHRDINPSNVFVTADGIVKILDFGIAKSDNGTVKTRTGSVKGTPHYLAPEQVLGEPIDRRADVFALGITLFELVTGTSPFRRDNEFLTQRAITDEQAPRASTLRADVPPALDDVIARAMARSPGDRFASAGAMAAALLAALGAPPAQPSAIGETIRKRFELEIGERRRKIARGLEALDEVDADGDRAPAGVPHVTAPLTVGSNERPTVLDTPVHTKRAQSSRRALLVVIAASLALGAVVVLTRHRDDERDTAVAPVLSAPSAVDAGTADAAAVRALVDARAPTAAPADAAVDTPVHVKRPQAKNPANDRAPGFLTIASRPYAEIFVDGRRLGVTPLYRASVSAGRHTVRAKCSCGKEQTFRIVIRSGAEAAPRTLKW